jgi:hypothetical protein
LCRVNPDPQNLIVKRHNHDVNAQSFIAKAHKNQTLRTELVDLQRDSCASHRAILLMRQALNPLFHTPQLDCAPSTGYACLIT